MELAAAVRDTTAPYGVPAIPERHLDLLRQHEYRQDGFECLRCGMVTLLLKMPDGQFAYRWRRTKVLNDRPFPCDPSKLPRK